MGAGHQDVSNAVVCSMMPRVRVCVLVCTRVFVCVCDSVYMCVCVCSHAHAR